MKISQPGADALTVKADTVVIGVYEEQPLTPSAAAINEASGGVIADVIASKDFTGKRHESLSLWHIKGVSARQVLLVGLGSRGKFDTGAAYRAGGTAAAALSTKPHDTIAMFLAEGWTLAETEAGLAGAIVACHGQDLRRAEKNRHPFKYLLWAVADEASLSSGRILGESVNLTRRLVNEPAQDMYPKSFADETKKVADECGLALEVWDQDKLEAERCGALLAVASGSHRPPRLVIARYAGGDAKAPWLAIVGKGVTFDSGGLSLKPPDGMLTMKCDMAGAATMLGAMRAISLLKLPVNVVGLAGLVENMTGGAAMKLGDVLHARNGRTIEVHNTDAEGRLVLADVLSVTLDLKVAKIIDLATLTGACVVALGTEVAGLMTNDQPWVEAVAEAARAVGEPVWQLPMYPEIYDELIKGQVADIKNVGDGRWGGAITAAKFLEQFVDTTPWVHIDIAGPAFRDKPKAWIDAGASGQFVRTLVEVARRWS
jgi:leucyl aminopeptidase